MILRKIKRAKFVKTGTAIFICLLLYYITFFRHFKSVIKHGTVLPSEPNLIVHATYFKRIETHGKPNSQSMFSYAKSFDLDPSFIVCNTTRPKPSDIIWRKGVYQKFKLLMKMPYGEQDVFIMNHYFDDRFFTSHNQRFLRAPVSIIGPGPLKNAIENRDTLEWAWKMNKTPFNAMLWYDGFQNPISVLCQHKGAAGLIRNVSNTYYFQQIMHCPVPEVNILPTHVSISYERCAVPQTYTDVIFPNPPRFPGSRDIGVCMASLYGTLNKTMLSYFVNWMEALNVFGVIEVSMNNATFQFGDKEIAAAFQYYIDKGLLTFTHFPVIHEKWPRTRKYDDDATESVNKLTTGDCFYRNLKRYWYTLIIDLDELPVPTRHDTYMEYLEEYLSLNPNLTDAYCLTTRSAFYYVDFPVGNPEYGTHLPILRMTNRYRPEPIEGSHDGVGISKSFHNPRNCIASGHHLCRAGHDLTDRELKRQFMPPEDILIHHYRNSCKYKDDCKKLQNDVHHDTVLPDRFGAKIRARVENVLTNLGWVF